MRKKLKKIFCVVLACATITCMMPTTGFADGANSSEPAKDANGSYEISNAADMIWFAEKVNGTSDEAAAKTLNAVLTKDIDMSAVTTWTPIGNSTANYKGVFNGQGHEIKGMNWTFNSAKSGLFGVNAGTIENISIEGAISSSVNFTGSIAGSNNGTISGCQSSVVLSLTGICKPSGGIAGGNYGTITSSSFSGSVILSDSVTSFTQLGGIAGCDYADGKITGCSNKGTIDANNSPSATAGGITGRIDGTGAVIRSCYNTGKITGKGQYVNLGGIIGICNRADALISNCYNAGEVTDANAAAVGPLIGKLGSSASSVKAADSYYLTSDAAAAEPAVTEAVLKSADIITKLNNISGEYTIDDANKYVKTSGYPELKWAAPAAVPVPVKTVTITGDQLTGAVLTAAAKGENDADATNVTYQWQQLITEEDDWGETTDEWTDIKDAVASTFTVPDTKDSLNASYRVTVKGESDSEATSTAFVIKALSNKGKLNADAASLDLSKWLKITKTGSISLRSAGANGSVVTWKSSDTALITDDGKIVALPESGIKDVTLTATLKLGTETVTKEFKLAVYSAAAQKDDGVLAAVAEKYQYGAVDPVYGTDTNLKAYMEKDIKAKGFDGVSVEIKSVEKQAYPDAGEAAIAANGDLTYYFKDPLALAGNDPYGNFNVVFTLKKGDATSELEKRVHLNWNTDKLYESLKTQMPDNLTWDVIKGSNETADNVKSDLTLPKYLNSKYLCELKWTSSDPAVISVDANKSDTIYGDYTGKVNRDKEDKTVKLTVTFDYRKIDSGRAGEVAAINKLTKTFDVKVPALNSDEIKSGMQKQLDDNYTVDKLKYITGGQKIDASAVTGDIQLLTGSKTGIKNYDSYKFTVTSDNTSNVAVNGYRADIFRPLPGEKAATVTLKVRMAQKSNNNIYVEKNITLTVKPLEQAEIDAAKQLMTKTISAYYDGIKGENTDQNDITKDMTAFQEAVLGTDGKVKFIYNYNETTGTGIVPVTYVEKTEAGGSDDQYTYFHSSNTKLIQSGIPRLVGKPVYNTKVVVDSYLSSDVYGKYYTKYMNAGDKDKAAIFAPLYRQHASASVTVKGEKGADPSPTPDPGTGDTKVKVAFQLVGSGGITWIGSTSVEISKDATAGDVVKKVLADNHYTYTGSMYYISSITTPAGEKLGEFDKGPNSGWLYSVNGVLPSLTLDQYQMKNGDQIKLYYTDDYTKEPGLTPTKPTTPTTPTTPTSPVVDPGFNGNSQTPGDSGYEKLGRVTKLKVKKSNGRFVITFKKVVNAEGYQIQYKTEKNTKYKEFTALKKLTINKYKTNKKYNAKKTYRIRVRAYKVVNGTRVNGAWSKVRVVKAKRIK